jgi:hypothetical protein
MDMKDKPLTVAQLLEALDGLDPDAPVVVGIINGPAFNAAYAQKEVRGGIMSGYICCYEQPRPWEGRVPTAHGDGTASLEHDPKSGPHG